MASYEEKPYLISQCAAFVLNKLANESSTKDGIEASFVINSDETINFWRWSLKNNGWKLLNWWVE